MGQAKVEAGMDGQDKRPGDKPASDANDGAGAPRATPPAPERNRQAGPSLPMLAAGALACLRFMDWLRRDR